MPQPDSSDRTEFGLENGSKLIFLIGDITRETCDAIVNAANSSLLGGGGVDGAIHRAGGPEILEQCKAFVDVLGGSLPPGHAVNTTAGNLPAKDVIHTVGPVWYGGDRNEAATLAECYRNSLFVAARRGLKSIAFPSISTGAFGYPTDKAAAVAVRTVVEELPQWDIREVRFVLFDSRTYQHYVNAAKEVLAHSGKTL